MYQTVFDRPQWPLRPDPLGARQYANVSNRLMVHTPEATHTVALAVPTGLFTLMRDVFKVLPEQACTLDIDLMENHREDMRYVFILHVHGDDGENYLLWDYPEDGLPRWMLSRDNWIA